MKVAIILKAPKFRDVVYEEDVIYVDAGYKFKKKIGQKNVIAVVGDFDSLGKIPKEENVIKLNEKKDFTDGEKAIRLAVEKGYDEITIYGALEGNIEHVLGNINLLKIAKDLGVKALIKDGDKTVQLITGKTSVVAKKESKFSILPFGEECTFKDSVGLYYPLKDVKLTSADTRGISNVTTRYEVVVELEKGEALLVYDSFDFKKIYEDEVREKHKEKITKTFQWVTIIVYAIFYIAYALCVFGIFHAHDKTIMHSVFAAMFLYLGVTSFLIYNTPVVMNKVSDLIIRTIEKKKYKGRHDEILYCALFSFAPLTLFLLILLVLVLITFVF